MLLLVLSTDKLQLVTDSAATVDVHASFADQSNADPPVTQGSSSGKQNTAISSATTTDIVASPTGGDLRNIKYLAIRNKDSSLSVTVTVRYNQNATTFDIRKVVLAAGDELHFDDGTWYVLTASSVPPTLLYALSADATGSNSNTAQPWFPTSGSVTVAGNTLYRFEGILELIRSAGTTSHTTGLLFAGTATLTSLQYHADVNTGDTETTVTEARTGIRVSTNTTVKAASSLASEVISISVRGLIRINAAGTLTPQFIYSSAPGGAPTIKANSYFLMQSLGSGSLQQIGTWS